MKLNSLKKMFNRLRGPSKQPRSSDFLNNVLCVPYDTSKRIGNLCLSNVTGFILFKSSQICRAA